MRLEASLLVALLFLIVTLLSSLDARKFNVSIAPKMLWEKKKRLENNATEEKKDRWGEKLVKKARKLAKKAYKKLKRTNEFRPYPKEIIMPWMDPCADPNRCKNQGKCRIDMEEGYTCECLHTYKGPNCQFLSDQRSCIENRCANGATCYSTLESNRVRNPDFNHSTTAVTRVPEFIDINYICWCTEGYGGNFCEEDELGAQACRDNCYSHGHGKDGQLGPECECACDEHFSGANCEWVSPCLDATCINGGICGLNPDNTSRCDCPSRVENFEGNITVSGENCETIELPDEWLDRLDFPCFGDWELANSTTIPKPSQREHKDRECANNGTCEIIIRPKNVVEMDTEYLLTSRCNCREGYTGIRCEEPERNFCDMEPDTSLYCGRHGECSYSRVEGLKCRCHSGYQGHFCNLRDPCSPNPCGVNASICVPLLTAADEVGEEVDKPSYKCMCTADQYMKDGACEGLDYAACANEEATRCAKGSVCMPCTIGIEAPDENPLCMDADWEKGFRCICQQGGYQPLCKLTPHQCESPRCRNNATCVPLAGDYFNYTCQCAPGFEGSWCETINDACLAAGKEACSGNGVCVNDRRRALLHYRCDCEAGWAGRLCEQKKMRKGYWMRMLDWLDIWTD